ncbi:trypsin-1-like [Chironomus tepperi]|uniref:trypsin-1-like n=1 Tax=Chironomus tepperi TaxID=113505 RepID=UPI00391F2495
MKVALGATFVYRHKIVGGYSADDDYQFPYQASLRDNIMEKHFCGAFVLTERWLGTAGHCTNKRKATGIIIVVGASNYSKDLGVRHTVLLIAVHPDFDAKILRNDISMIKTETFIDFTPTVKPVKMLAMPPKPDTVVFVSGFGRTSSGTIPETLQWIKMKTTTFEDCVSLMTKQNKDRIFETNVCAMPTDTTEGGACMGDSGGPLVQDDGSLIGIVSWGVPCGQGMPDIFTRVSAYKDWIDSIIDFPTVAEYHDEDDDDDDDDLPLDERDLDDYDFMKNWSDTISK